jgi:hypothetical protein
LRRLQIGENERWREDLRQHGWLATRRIIGVKRHAVATGCAPEGGDLGVLPRPPASLAIASAFIASTGKTQGMRLRMSPPASASSKAWESAMPGGPTEAAVTGSAVRSRKLSFPVGSRSAKTPASG